MNRRDFLSATAATTLAGSLLADELPRSTPPKRDKEPTRKLAVVATAYYYLSHAYHICGRFLNGYLKHGKYYFPDFQISGVYVEQKKAGDLSQRLSKKHGFTIFNTIADALTLGTGKLAVDGVLLIGEHGDYPYNAKGQKQYPRFEMFQQIVEVFRDSNKTAPVFNDKHLCFDRRKAFEMASTAKKMSFPLMAGSSLPVTWRRPELELPLGVKIKEAMVVSRGELEVYGIHALEAVQCMIERRTKGQQGVKTVECLEGDAVWKAGDDGRWSWELLENALGRSPSRNVGDVRENCAHYPPSPAWGYRVGGPRAFLIEYLDGLKGTVLQLDGHVADDTFAAQIDGEKKPVSTLFWLPPPPGAAFLEALASHVETFMDSGKPPYPIERTLLTGGILDCVLDARVQKKKMATPDLEISYEPPKDSGFMRGDYVSPV